jgi:hypothetical protein
MLTWFRKATAAFVAAGVSSLGVALTPLSDGGTTIVQGEYITALVVAAIAATAVFTVPANTPRNPVVQVIDDATDF